MDNSFHGETDFWPLLSFRFWWANWFRTHWSRWDNIGYHCDILVMIQLVTVHILDNHPQKRINQTTLLNSWLKEPASPLTEQQALRFKRLARRWLQSWILSRRVWFLLCTWYSIRGNSEVQCPHRFGSSSLPRTWDTGARAILSVELCS